MSATAPAPKGNALRVIGGVALAVVLTAGLALLLLVLAGVFQRKVPTESGPAPAVAVTGDPPLAAVRLVRKPRFESAVGTVRAVHESALASKILARVVEVRVKAGQAVTRDEVLVRLDDSDLQARHKQAEAAEAAAKANKDKADLDLERANRLLAGRALSQDEYDRAVTATRATAADLERTRQAVREAKVMLDYATLRAPLTGIVVDKRVEVGDTVTPGQTLLTLYDPSRMQMIVTVRESLARRLTVGQKVPGRLESLGYDCEATVSEIVPESQPGSRSFTVKVIGPCPPGVLSGMFGRIYVPLDEEEITVVPAEAVIRVGQLDAVAVADNGTVQRRSVQLGRRLDEGYEVLSGLKPGEKVLVQRPSVKEGSR